MELHSMNSKKILYVIMTFILIAFSYCTVKAEGASNNTERKEIPDSSAVVAVLSTYTYNTIGVIRTPSVTVTDANGIVLAKGVDYTVTYDKGRMEPGEYNVIVTLIGNYSGSRNLSFTIKGNSGKVNQSGKWSYKNKKVKHKIMATTKAIIPINKYLKTGVWLFWGGIVSGVKVVLYSE